MAVKRFRFEEVRTSVIDLDTGRAYKVYFSPNLTTLDITDEAPTAMQIAGVWLDAAVRMEFDWDDNDGG